MIFKDINIILSVLSIVLLISCGESNNTDVENVNDSQEKQEM